ncbi:unnamed protein product [Durusdinium trenchii]|uniref:Uncharacterized protein n=1 Tax=Durusdinium trenchii TaxID=1381693 RepID=A0ABP0JLK1_9DINO
MPEVDLGDPLFYGEGDFDPWGSTDPTPNSAEQRRRWPIRLVGERPSWGLAQLCLKEAEPKTSGLFKERARIPPRAAPPEAAAGARSRGSRGNSRVFSASLALDQGLIDVLFRDSLRYPEDGYHDADAREADRFVREPEVAARGFVSRFNTPVKDSRSVNVDLYDEVFRPVGVSMMQYERLMSFANKCKATPGSVVVPGGKSNGRFVLLTYGAAVAHKHGPESPEKLGDPICVYLGRLTPRQSLSPQLLEKGPVRGSVVGGSALVDGSVTEKVYPSDIVAAEPTEWLEWDLDDLQRIIDAPGWRAVQASFYHLQLGTLDRDRASKIKADDKTKVKGSAEAQPNEEADAVAVLHRGALLRLRLRGQRALWSVETGWEGWREWMQRGDRNGEKRRCGSFFGVGHSTKTIAA